MTSHLIHPKYRPDINGLRAVAVLSVVIFHAFPGRWMKGGFIGVDIFFVISGYLISTILFENLNRGTFSFNEFYSRRIRRIFPALVIVLAGSLILGWFALFANEYAQIGKHVAAGAGFVSNLVLREESGYFDNAAETKPLLHLWSLGVEEQFYIIYPLLLWFAWRRMLNLLSVSLVLAAVSFCLNVSAFDKQPNYIFYSPQTRFWELMCGGLLAWMMLYRRESWTRPKATLDRWISIAIYREPVELDGRCLSNAASALGLLLLVYGFLHIGRSATFPGTWALIPVLGSVLIISAGPESWINKKIMSNQLAVWVGLISYPLYLWHWPLLSFARIMEGAVPGRGIRAAAVVASIVLAWLTYVVVEKPFRSGNRNKAKVVILVAMMSSIAGLGYCTYKSEGLPSRSSMAQFKSLVPQFSWASLGRPVNATLMLLGDSHASHLIPGLRRYFGDKLIADYTSFGCIPFYDIDRYDSRYVPGACAAAMNAALGLFESSNEMTGIILSSMGPVYLSGAPFNGASDARVVGDNVVLTSNPKITDRWEVYAYAMQNTLERLSRANKKILFVLDVPELGFEPTTCIASRPLVLTGKRDVCAVSRAAYDARVQRYKALVYSVLKGFPNVMVYDPVNDFCDDKRCWAMKDGTFLYRDSDHLSNEGSYLLVGRMRSLIEKL